VKSERSRRRSVEALASTCVAAAVLSGCSSGSGDQHAHGQPLAQPPPRPAVPALDAAAMEHLADELRATVPCTRADALLDDLAFWDSMHGFDCFDRDAPTFIRVYAHAASVPQTLAEWDGTFGSGRAVTRGANWYVIGTPAIVSAVKPPSEAPRTANDLGSPVPLTAEQDYLTTCMLYVSSEGERYVRHPEQRSASADQYGPLFPGVTAAVHAAVDDLGRGRVSEIRDKDRWIAALSPIGPRLKQQCGAAYRAVGNSVHSLDGDRG
jgi:hypothetical protein